MRWALHSGDWQAPIGVSPERRAGGGDLKRVFNDLPEQRETDAERATNPTNLPEKLQKKFNNSVLSVTHNSGIAQAFGSLDAPSYRDDFSDASSGWKTATDAKAIREYRNGQLSITLTKDSGTAQITLPRSILDFAAEIEVVPVAGIQGAYYGMVLRKNGEKFIAFVINDQGDYAIISRDGEKNILLIKPVKSPAIKTGFVANKIKVYATDNLFLFEVNGTAVTSINVDGYAAGDLAVVLSRSNNPEKKTPK